MKEDGKEYDRFEDAFRKIVKSRLRGKTAKAA